MPAKYVGEAPPRPGIPLQRFEPGAITLRPFCTTIDWLSVMMCGPWHSITNPPGTLFAWDVPNVRPGLSVYCAGDINHPQFQSVFYVVDRSGAKVVTISAHPRDLKKFPLDFCVVQFDNSTLPTGEWRELNVALREMGCEWMGVQRIDIAADGWEDPSTLNGGGDFVSVVHAAMAGWGQYYGKANWSTYHERREFMGFQFGSRAGNKYLRCYKKKREMKANRHKPHVVAAWRNALGGLDPMRDVREVGRLEVRMKGKELRRYYPGEMRAADVEALHDPALRVDVFVSTTGTLFDFRQWPRDGRARTAKPMHVWDWSLCTTNAPTVMPRAARTYALTEHTIKVALRAMAEAYLASADQDVLLIAERYARSAGSEWLDYFRRKLPDWERIHRTRALGCADAATRSFMQRLSGSVCADRDPLKAWNEAAQAVPYTECDPDA